MEVIIGTEITDDGLRLGHTWHEVEVLATIIKDMSPDYFVEIGIHEGVLSRELMSRKPDYVNYVGVEINCGIIRVDYSRGRLICGDCFSPEVMDAIDALPGRRIIYCDGGAKAKELLAYSTICRYGDMILAHDFDDGTRSGMGLPEKIAAEVHPSDIEFFESMDFISFGHNLFAHTRIIGFYKT